MGGESRRDAKVVLWLTIITTVIAVFGFFNVQSIQDLFRRPPPTSGGETTSSVAETTTSSGAGATTMVTSRPDPGPPPTTAPTTTSDLNPRTRPPGVARRVRRPMARPGDRQR